MIIKLSYSILNAWSNKRFEDAVNMYLGTPLPKTAPMELGSLKHEQWQKYIEEFKELPADLGGGKLTNPVCEQKYQKLIPLGKYQILLRGAPDCTDGADGYEFKCGMTPISTYMGGLQLDYYKLLCPELTTGIYIAHNPYAKRYTKGIKYLSEENAEKALNHIITMGGEMIDYMQSQKLLVDYTKKYEESMA